MKLYVNEHKCVNSKRKVSCLLSSSFSICLKSLLLSNIFLMFLLICIIYSAQSVQLSLSVLSHSLRPHELQLSRLPCPSPTPRACSNSCLSSPWCHPTISSSVTLFSSGPQFFLASESFPTSWLLTSGGQSIGASASGSVLLMNIQG